MLRLETHGRVTGVQRPLVLKVVSEDQLGGDRYNATDCAVLVDSRGRPPTGYGAAIYAGPAPVDDAGGPTVASLREPTVLAPGDVIRLVPGSSLVKVLYRRGGSSNVLFITERCNSKCLMCSQPPREDDDSWRFSELFKLVQLIDHSEQRLGITGGEPTMLGTRLGELIEYCAELLPNTSLHVLSNGRAFKDANLARAMEATGHSQLSWGIPLYSDSPEIHDFVVQSRGAFIETVHGIYNLAEYGQRIEIRVVLHRPAVNRLLQITEFIFQNMPFVDHVALMGVESIGYAPANRESLWIDPIDFSGTLESAVQGLAVRGIPVSIYNLPLCTVPHSLWPYYRQSISDWKNVFLEPCETCAARSRCGGFFASIRTDWLSRGLRPFSAAELEQRIGEHTCDIGG